MIIKFIKKLYAEYSSVKGPVKSEVFKKLIPEILEKYEGDILEIGAYKGDTTKIFLEFAEKYDRKVYVVDPWSGPQEGNDKVYEDFLKKVGDNPRLTVYRMGSQDPSTKKLIRDMNLCFAFVDGLHTPEACKSDILVCQEAVKQGVVVVDDIRNAYGSQFYADAIFNMVKSLDYKNGWAHYPSPDGWQYTLLLKSL